MCSGNLVFFELIFFDFVSGLVVISFDQVMIFNGIVNKIGILLLLIVLIVVFVWSQVVDEYGQIFGSVSLYVIGGVIGGLVLVLIIIFKKEWLLVIVLMYVLVEGLFLGVVLVLFNMKYLGIVFQVVLLIFGILVVLLFVYCSGLIKVIENFKMGVVVVIGGIVLFYFVLFVLGFFNINVLVIYDFSWLGIVFSLFVVVVVVLNLVLDFDFIEIGVVQCVLKYMEWYGVFGLMVILVWLYVEFLCLLLKIQQC